MHNHIRKIDEIFEIKIKSDARDGYKYKVAGDDDGGQPSPLQENLIAHLRMAIGGKELQERVVMNPFHKFRWFSPLSTAMQKGIAIVMTYFAQEQDCMHNERAQQIVIEPYFINQFDNWFLVGRAKEDGNLHAYAFRSIRAIEVTEEPFEMPKDFDPTAYLADPPYIANSTVANDDELFLAERVGCVANRSRWGAPFAPAEGEIDYRQHGLTNEKLAFKFLNQARYKQRHPSAVFIDTTPEYEDLSIHLKNYIPHAEPYIRVLQFDSLIDAKITIKEGKCIDCNQNGMEHPELLSQLVDRVGKWLDAPCADRRFNGANREYALWLWRLLAL